MDLRHPYLKVLSRPFLRRELDKLQLGLRAKEQYSWQEKDYARQKQLQTRGLKQLFAKEVS